MNFKIMILAGAWFMTSCNSGHEREGSLISAQLKNDTIMKDTLTNAKNLNDEVCCKLTNADLQRRKETVIASLKKHMLEKRELTNGYAYKFKGNDAMVDELAEFVKTERSCCSFFIFGLSFSGDGSEAWLNLTGPEGTKEMIRDELGL